MPAAMQVQLLLQQRAVRSFVRYLAVPITIRRAAAVAAAADMETMSSFSMTVPIPLYMDICSPWQFLRETMSVQDKPSAMLAPPDFQQDTTCILKFGSTEAESIL